jgi:hypothetical protein
MLEHDQEFMALQIRCHQIYHIPTLMESQLKIPFSFSALARGFGGGCDRVIQALLHNLEPPDARGRHLALADDAEGEILTGIETQEAKSAAVTAEHILGAPARAKNSSETPHSRKISSESSGTEDAATCCGRHDHCNVPARTICH